MTSSKEVQRSLIAFRADLLSGATFSFTPITMEPLGQFCQEPYVPAPEAPNVNSENEITGKKYMPAFLQFTKFLVYPKSVCIQINVSKEFLLLYGARGHSHAQIYHF